MLEILNSKGGGKAQPGPILLVALSAVAAVLFLSIYFIDRRQHSLEINALEYGQDWPWPSVAKATVQCHVVRDKDGNQRPFIQVNLNGSVYALNAPALEASGWQDSRMMMDRDANGAFKEGARSDIVRRGREICGLPAPRS